MPRNEKKLLITSTHFPPDARPGTHRVTRFIKYLAKFGWDISVLTLKLESRFHTVREDAALVNKIPPSVKVYRTTAPRLAWPFSGLNSYLVPDIESTWIPFACSKGVRIIKEQGIPCVFSTAPPWTTHVICSWFKRRTGIKWVADIRDPWTRRPWMPVEQRRGVRYNILKRIERAVVHTADRVVLNTEPLYRDFCSYYQEIDPKKFLTIMNGIDPDDYRDLPSSYDSNPDRFVITHGGSLYRKRDPRPFLRAVSELVKEKAITERNLIVQFIGGIGSEFDIHRWIRELDLEAVVRVEPQIPHERYLGLLSESNMLLCIQPQTDLQVPSKLFEYIAVGKPILALVHDGATRDIVEQYSKGIARVPEDVAGIKEAILTVVRDENRMTDRPDMQNQDVVKFSVATSAQKLDKILTECLVT